MGTVKCVPFQVWVPWSWKPEFPNSPYPEMGCQLRRLPEAFKGIWLSQPQRQAPGEFGLLLPPSSRGLFLPKGWGRSGHKVHVWLFSGGQEVEQWPEKRVVAGQVDNQWGQKPKALFPSPLPWGCACDKARTEEFQGAEEQCDSTWPTLFWLGSTDMERKREREFNKVKTKARLQRNKGRQEENCHLFCSDAVFMKGKEAKEAKTG